MAVALMPLAPMPWPEEPGPSPEDVQPLSDEASEATSPEESTAGSSQAWTTAEVTAAREQCMHLMQSSGAEAQILEPIRSDQCGTPAPVLLKSIGSADRVVFDPPVQVNCRMMAALDRWSRKVLQPAARDTLGSPVERIVGASGYSCRNVYNKAEGNLSQHAFANAIDMSVFALKDGRTFNILEGWGPTTAELAAEAKARARARLKSVKDATGPAKAQAATRPPAHAAGAALPLAKASLLPDKKLAGTSALAAPAPAPLPAKAAASAPAAARDRDAPRKPPVTHKFLNRLHAGACGNFRTVMGPESNAVHRNHFHFDLNGLRGQTYCE